MGMWIYMLILIMCIFSAFSGALVSFLYISHIEKKNKKKKVRYVKERKSKDTEKTVTEEEGEFFNIEEPDNTQSGDEENPLDKIVPRESFTEMNCEFDGTEEKNIAVENAKKQDDKYNRKFLNTQQQF